MEKENLDTFFRDSLDEFSKNPDPEVWERIQASLDGKARKRRRGIALWWPLAGAAAALALLFFLVIPDSAPEAVPETNVVVEEPALSPSEDAALPDAINSGSADQNALVEAPAVSKTEEAQLKQSSRANSVAARNQKSGEQAADQAVLPSAIAVTQTEGLPETNDTKQPIIEKEQIAADAQKESMAITGGDPHPEDNREKTDPAAEPMLAEADNLEKEKAYQELIGEEDMLPDSELNSGKWAVGPSVAPVFFDKSGGGSPIDQAFVSNTKSGNLNMSFGLQVSYQIGKRWQLRSGLHKVDFSYDTEDIVFSSSVQASSATLLPNIDFDPAAEYLVVNSQKTTPTKADLLQNEVTARNASREGTMVQEFGYLEIPMEVNYTLIDKTFGLNIISGISSLFLVDNVINLESTTGSTQVGQANNLNSVNFSANVGLGFHYKMSDKIDVQVEPLIKYQLNTFSNTAGDFRPYSIGVYSGLRYKF